MQLSSAVDTELEKSILSLLLHTMAYDWDRSDFNTVYDLMVYNDFYVRDHKLLFWVIKKYDKPMVAFKKYTKSIEWNKVLEDIVITPVPLEPIKTACLKLRYLAMKRMFLKALYNTINKLEA